VCLLDEGKLEIFGSEGGGFSVFEHHRIVRVFDIRGHRYANIVIPYGARSSVEGIEARTILPDGTIHVLDPERLFDVSLYPNFVFFSDQRAKIFTLPAVDDGSVLEYRYRLVIHDRTFWHAWNFQDNIPTQVSRFTLVTPSELKVEYRTYAITLDPTIQKAPSGFKSTLVWEAREVHSLVREFGMPPRPEAVARLALAPLGFTAWDDVAKWYHEVSTPRMEAGEVIRSLAATVTEGAVTPQEKLRRVYEWVRGRIRYLAVEIGTGGFQPHPAEQVCLNRYGDCKDMVTLLCTLARQAGIEAHQVLVSTWQNGVPDTTLPSPLQFNHVIAYAPGVGEGGTWMDPTDKGSTFGQLPWYDQGRPVLVVDAGGKARLRTTPRTPAERNRQDLHWQLKLLPDGSVTGEGRTVMTGAPAAELRDELLNATASERRQWLETFLARESAGSTLGSFSLDGLEGSGDSLQIVYAFRAPRYAVRRDDYLSIRPAMHAASDLPDFLRPGKRVHPVRFRFGMERTVSLTLALPAGWRAESPAKVDSLVSTFGCTRLKWAQEGNVLSVECSSRLNGENVPPGRYGALQEFLDAMQVRDLTEIVLRRDAMHAGAAP
jgi:hypothetical protein